MTWHTIFWCGYWSKSLAMSAHSNCLGPREVQLKKGEVDVAIEVCLLCKYALWLVWLKSLCRHSNLSLHPRHMHQALLHLHTSMPTLPLCLPTHPSPLIHLTALADATLPVAHPPITALAVPPSAVCNAHCATQICAINHKQEVLHDGPMCDLLWSDPDGMCHCLMHHASHIPGSPHMPHRHRVNTGAGQEPVAGD